MFEASDRRGGKPDDAQEVYDLTDRVAVVTGVLGRLGLVWSEALLSAGAKVAGIDLVEAPTSSAWKALQDRFGSQRLTLLRANVLDRGSLEAARARCSDEMGAPAILVNNAGVDQPPTAPAKSYRLHEIPADVVRAILDVNFLGAFQVAQVFGQEMVHRREGSIINIGSLYASVSPDCRLYDHIDTDPPFLKPPAYGASKAALVNLTKYLATHWGAYGVRVNTLSPGGVLGDQDEVFKEKFTSRVPLGRMAVDRDLVGPLLFLASDASSYVTGTELLVDGGFTAW